MKKNITFFSIASFLLGLILVQTAHAQNTSPFWSLAGNSNANSVSKLGTTTADPLNLTTNNITRLKIFAGGQSGFGANITTANATRVLNLADPNAVMRILRISGTNAPAIELLSRTSSDGANVAYWDMYAEPSDASFRIRDRQTGSNLDRFTINHASGFVGIGTTTPNYLLDVTTNSASIGQFKSSSSLAGVIIDRGSASTNEYLIHRSLGVDKWTEGMIGNDNFSLHNWGGTGTDALTIDHTNNYIGISTTSPAYGLDLNGRLRIRNSGQGTAGLWVNNTSNSNVTGFFGTLNDNHMGWYGASNGWSVLMNTDNGYLGVKNTDPQTELHVIHGTNSGATFGLRIQNVGSNNNEWTEYVQNSNGNFSLYHNGALRGNFDATSGAYTSVSDARLKKNVEKSEDVLDNIMKLGVKRYQFTQNQTDGRRYYGMIAQEVEKVFPDIVFHNKSDDGKDFYTMDYSATGVIAIKGIQELKPVFDKQQEQINQLQQEVAELKQMVARLSGGQTALSSASGTLELAMPNPAKGATRIQYALPEGASNARLVVTDASGRTVKVMQLSTSGIANVDVSSLSAGVYNYSLVADGKTLQTKKMTVQR